MCLILKQTARNPLSDAEITAIYTRNRDGFGVAWHDDDGTPQYWRRVPVNAADAVSLYRHALALATEDRPIVAHWRMATSGSTVDDLAHPFGLPGACLIHNGVLPDWTARARPGQSDTAALAAYIARIVTESGMSPDDVYTSDAFRTWMQREATGSAIVIVRANGQIDHYGNAGLEHADRWLSNTYAGPASLYPPRPVTTYTRSGGWYRWDDDTPIGAWVRTRSGGWVNTPTAHTPTSDKPPSDRPATSTTTTVKVRESRKRAKRARIRADLMSGPPDLTRPGVIAAGSIREVADACVAWATSSDGWFLLDDDLDIARWGIDEFAATLQPADGLAVRVVDLPRDRVLIRVIDVADLPRVDRDPDAPDPRT